MPAMFSKWFKSKSKPSASTPVPIPQPAAESEVESPCNGVCEMDWANNICKSCYRTPNEIGAWSSLGDEAKLAINAAALERGPS